MNVPRSHRLLAWLLPLFLLRAFIPVGFMLSWSDAGLQLVMCSGSGPVPVPEDVTVVVAEQHHGGSHAGSGQHEHSRADSGTMCPFAAAGSSGALPSFDATVAFVATLSNAARPLPTLDLSIRAVLIDRIRGPPLA